MPISGSEARALVKLPAKRRPSCCSIAIVNGTVVNDGSALGSTCSETSERCTISAVPLQQYLERNFPALPPDERRSTRRQLAIALAGFFARLHDAGRVLSTEHSDEGVRLRVRARSSDLAALDPFLVDEAKPDGTEPT